MAKRKVQDTTLGNGYEAINLKELAAGNEDKKTDPIG